MCIYFLSSDYFYLEGLAETIKLTGLQKTYIYDRIDDYDSLIDKIKEIEMHCKKDDIVVFDFENIELINLCTMSALKNRYKVLFVIDHTIRDGFFFYNRICFLSKKGSLSLICYLIMKIALFQESPPTSLTIREHLILSLMSQGVEQREIARLLKVSNQSVSRYKRVIEHKTGMGNCNSFLFMKYSRVLTQLNN